MPLVFTALARSTRTAGLDRHLPLETFKKLVPAFSETRHVHLQGWGEPFLHPDFFEMVAIAKGAGCRVGTTTNGMLLNRETIERVVESRLDIIAFSLAGTGEENDRIRKGTRLAKVLEAMHALTEEKQRRGVETPAIHVAYMLFQSGIGNLRNLPRLLEGCGVSDVVISFLDFIPCEELQSEVIAPATEAEHEELRSCLEEVKEEGRLHHLHVHHPLESMGEKKGHVVHTKTCIGARKTCKGRFASLQMGPSARVSTRICRCRGLAMCLKERNVSTSGWFLETSWRNP